MNDILPQIYLVRHGETAWSISGQHTGLTDIPLTENGENNAKRLSERLRDINFAAVYSSPLLRAKRTCELAGFGSVMQLEPDLVEWDYGDYEGLTTAEILKKQPGWSIFRDGCPGGESIEDISTRAGRLIARLKKVREGNVLLFSHGHMLRVLAARWLVLPAEEGSLFTLAPTSISILGYEHNLDEPVIRLWNQTS
jgi:broad specificity phosphatase PhoE